MSEVTLYLGDCREWLKEISPVDTVITLDTLITCGSVYLILIVISIVVLGVIARSAQDDEEAEDGWRAL